jgi:hypothetical protein
MKAHAAPAVDPEQAAWSLLARQLGVGSGELAPESWLDDDAWVRRRLARLLVRGVRVEVRHGGGSARSCR